MLAGHRLRPSIAFHDLATNLRSARVLRVRAGGASREYCVKPPSGHSIFEDSTPVSESAASEDFAVFGPIAGSVNVTVADSA